MITVNNDIKNPKSPLRFPGSKSKAISKFYYHLLYPHNEYREPFFGGGSVFFSKPKAQQNWLNDKDPSVSVFWSIVRDQPLELCKMIDLYYPSIDLWLELKHEPNDWENTVKEAFKFLFFNRTNYSGIFNANPIGGLKQGPNTKYKIDCRWNPNLLKSRILECSNKLQQSRITNLDYEEVILSKGEDVFLFIDPPYYQKGHILYKVSLSTNEHVLLANLLKETKHPFLLTIDNCDFTRELYNWAPFLAPTSWRYTVNSKKKDNQGQELLISNFKIS